MIAYFILVHRYPEQFKRLFKAIYSEGNQYVIHIDKSSGTDFANDIIKFLENYKDTEIIESKKALWGGYSLVDAELRGMKKLLDMSKNWKYYINLSGQDFPLKSQKYIREFFNENKGREYIRALDQRIARPETMNRINEVFVEIFSKIFRTGISRAFLKNTKPYIGTQWKAVSRAFCQSVTSDDLSGRFKSFYKNSFIADEGFFQTFMMNVFNKSKVVNDDLRTIDWVPDGDIKLRPRNFNASDFLRLSLSPDLFARKFDEFEDVNILGMLERHLLTPSATEFASTRKIDAKQTMIA